MDQKNMVLLDKLINKVVVISLYQKCLIFKKCTETCTCKIDAKSIQLIPQLIMHDHPYFNTKSLYLIIIDLYYVLAAIFSVLCKICKYI